MFQAKFYITTDQNPFKLSTWNTGASLSFETINIGKFLYSIRWYQIHFYIHFGPILHKHYSWQGYCWRNIEIFKILVFKVLVKEDDFWKNHTKHESSYQLTLTVHATMISNVYWWKKFISKRLKCCQTVEKMPNILSFLLSLFKYTYALQ